LITKLDVVVVKKTTLNVQDPVKASNALLGEQASKEIANKTANAVMLKNLLCKCEIKFKGGGQD